MTDKECIMVHTNKILLIDDAPDVQLIVTRALNDEHNQVFVATTSNDALTMVRTGGFDLILLDISLPDGDGFELCSKFQNDPQTKNVPVVFITGSESPSSAITAYSLGADNYLQKPIRPVELKIIVENKIQKNKRRAHQAEDPLIGPFRFSLGSQRVWTVEDGVLLDLTPREFKILYFLAKHEPNVFSRVQILSEVWGQNNNVVDRTIDTHIYSLRKKIGAFARHIESVPGTGYRFVSGNGHRQVS